MKLASSTPGQVRARHALRFDFTSTPGVHTRGNPYISHFFNALSILAPHTESMLIRIMRPLRKDVLDAKLSEDVAGFLAQEALHSRHHASLNARLAALGYDVERADALIRAETDSVEKGMDPRTQLAVVIAGEHVIYELSHFFLRDSRCSEAMAPEVRRLFEWHCAEEVEHQSVAHDVYRAAYPRDAESAAALKSALTKVGGALSRSIWGTFHILLASEGALDPRDLAAFLKFMLVTPGLARRVGLRIPRFLDANFEPWSDPDDRSLVDVALSAIESPTRAATLA